MTGGEVTPSRQSTASSAGGGEIEITAVPGRPGRHALDNLKAAAAGSTSSGPSRRVREPRARRGSGGRDVVREISIAEKQHEKYRDLWKNLNEEGFQAQRHGDLALPELRLPARGGEARSSAGVRAPAELLRDLGRELLTAKGYSMTERSGAVTFQGNHSRSSATS